MHFSNIARITFRQWLTLTRYIVWLGLVRSLDEHLDGVSLHEGFLP